MRFKDLDQEAAAYLWDRWTDIIRETLDEFNDDVYHGGGIVRGNSYYEKTYLALETKKECFYVFPIAGNALGLGLWRSRMEKEYLSRKSTTNRFDPENLIGGIVVKSGRFEERYATDQEKRRCLQKALRLLYLKYRMNLLF